jgi:hypothetical protein
MAFSSSASYYLCRLPFDEPFAVLLMSMPRSVAVVSINFQPPVDACYSLGQFVDNLLLSRLAQLLCVLDEQKPAALVQFTPKTIIICALHCHLFFLSSSNSRRISS